MNKFFRMSFPRKRESRTGFRIKCGMTMIFLVIILLFPAAVFAQTVDLFNPLKWVGVEKPEELVFRVLGTFAGFMAIGGIAFTVFNGFKLIIASNEESITKAKEGLKWSVGGFVVGILAFTVVSGTARFLAFEPGQINLGEEKVIKNPILLPGDTSGLRSGDFVEVMNFLMVNFLGIVGFATILMIIYYGFKYITAAGNEEAIEQAKTGLKWAIIGFVVTILAYTIISSVQRLLFQGPPA